MLAGALEGEDLERYIEERVPTGRLEDVLNQARARAVFPLTFGLACCAIEMMSTRHRAIRHRALRGRSVPRVTAPGRHDHRLGRVSIKMAPVIRRVYDQMLEPKWVISMGDCSSSGGMFANYAVVQGADRFMPVDIHIPGCPPRPEALLHGFNKLQAKIKGEPDLGWRERYNAAGTEEWARHEPGAPSEEALASARRIAAMQPLDVAEAKMRSTPPNQSPAAPGREAEEAAVDGEAGSGGAHA